MAHHIVIKRQRLLGGSSGSESAASSSIGKLQKGATSETNQQLENATIDSFIVSKKDNRDNQHLQAWTIASSTTASSMKEAS